MKSMLLIESPVLAKVFAEVFEKLAWAVAICTSRDCAMRQAAGSAPYDLILLSDHVPGTNGVQLIRFIRSVLWQPFGGQKRQRTGKSKTAHYQP